MDSKTVASRAHHTPRLEDDALLRGLGRYAADAPLTGQAQAYFVRSPHAFADIKSIDTAAAKKVKGVLAVLTGADMDEAKLGNLSAHPPVAGRGGTKLVIPVRPALATKTVRHVGEAVAVVVAETLAAAQDGAEAVVVEYAERAPAVDLREAIKNGAPQVWPEAPGNIAVDWLGMAADPAANAKQVEEAFASAAHRVRASVLHQRIVVASMEPRGATASYDKANDSYFLRACSQSARALRDGMAPIIGVPNPKLRVVTEDVGGAFGLKTGPYPEYAAILVAAKQDRPAGALDVEPRGIVPQRQPRPRRLFATSSSRSTRAASSWRCASAISATWAPISARSAPTSRPSTCRAACRACTTSR